LFCLLLAPAALSAQGVTRFTYHDAEKRSLKEIFQVRDTVRNHLHGRYISYYLNGNIESKGQFVNNETSGVWEFFYETGNLKMRGILRQSSNYGLWEYFYENGQRSMEGTINGKNKEGVWKIYYESGELKEEGMYVGNKREGLWKVFFEDGRLKGEIEYKEDHGRFTEYYPSGKVAAEGPKVGPRQVGLWRFFDEKGVLQGDGEYANGKKNGVWHTYYPSGKKASEGRFENDVPVGSWTYFFEEGTVSSSGEYVGGQKNGYWNALNPDGSKRSEVNYSNGVGEYREYYTDGRLRAKGQIVDGRNEGKWQYYFNDGKLEGECEFDSGKGTYYGYYPSGTLQTKGTLENDLRVGTWELYETDGKLSGYYRPIYEKSRLADEINALAIKAQTSASTTQRSAARGFTYFQPRFPEYRGVIIEGNPMLSFIGLMPLGIEFYNEERLGHVFEFEGIRNPFFTADARVPQNKIFQRGYAIGLKQKFYNPWRNGMWYFAHEARFTNLGHYANVDLNLGGNSLVTANATEQRAEYGVLLGTRLMQQNDRDGFTIDAYLGYGLGFRNFDADPLYENVFVNVNQRQLSHGVRFGLNLGFAVSFEGR
jgi:antitoxin component YwqK of YwqJK toxin-antitoxin module